MATSEKADDNEFVLPLAAVLLLQALVALVYIIPIESDLKLSADLRLRYLEPVLFLTPLTTALIYRWRPALGRWFAVLAPAVMVFALQVWLPIPGSLALLAIATGLAAWLIGPRAAVAVAAASMLGLFMLRTLTNTTDGWQIGIALTAILSTLILALTVHQSVTNVATWSRNYYLDAVRLMQENRANRGALQQAVDDLAHVNRQMTLLYERQTVLQHMAEEAERTKSSFVAKVSHEFRTPLNMIIGLASVMLENPHMYGRSLPPALMEDLQIIYRNCNHLASLVNDVLALSQLQAGNIVLHREELDIATTIGEALEVVRPLIIQKKLQCTVEIPEQLPPLTADRTRIRQVILNLLSNAARFTEQGSISVRVSQKNQQVTIAVTDSGPGIASTDMERIFEPFCQGPDQVWREKGGSGLGLTISKQFVELHGGRIWLESTLGVGSTFFVALPGRPPAMLTRLPDSWISREWQWIEREHPATLPRLPDQPRIVLYDTTSEVEPEISRYAAGVEVVTTDSLAAVIAEVQATPAHVVLLSARQTDELLPLLRQAAEELPDTPLFGWALPPRTAAALRAGADQYLVKPLSLASLKERLGVLRTPIHNVLIADDDDEARVLLARMLLFYDSTLAITVATSGAQALQFLEAASFDLLLLDVMMPEVDGLQVLEQMRSDPRTRHMPVIVISAQDMYAAQPVCGTMVLQLGKGMQLSKALECAISVSQILFTPVVEPYPVPG